ncbi:MAG: LacI family transcriptional regulator, repressor for deo operon, udp, cdd, tsx, nupC, and nupG [Solirubrobacteraceae bacterium]|nr:LacI family transcriptional regulator, repressor for deo operon, udp, cdd, tsx, nupC, and nupG [Solirubrobacteraceae bacterium]
MPARPDSRVTSVDVARAAGCSQSTVSLVLSGKAGGRVSDATADSVRRVARELGYRPNVAARTLRSGAARAVGLVVPDVTNPFFARVLRGAQHAARETGHAVALIEATYDETDADALPAGAVDGFLFFAREPPASVRRDPHLRSVLVETTSDDVAFVRLDVEAGATAAAEHLLALGHRRIGHLRAAVDEETFHLRASGIAAALGAAGLDPADQPWTEADVAFQSAREGGLRLLGTADPPTALLCDDDLMAGGAYLAARDLGLAIPGDVAIVGFDDLDFTVVLDPPLTTVHADAEDLGAQAFEVLAELMAGGSPASRVLAVQLVVRGSTVSPSQAR